MRFYRRKTKRKGKPVWWASWTEGGVTKRRSTKCSSKAAAELVYARWERERADPIYAAAQNATFGVEAGLFLVTCESAVTRGKLSAGTLKMYRQKAGALVRILGSGLRLADIDASTFPRYLDARREESRELREKEAAESNLYKEWVTFRQILKQAWREQRYGRDPASLKPAHFGPEYKPRETALTWKQVTTLINELDGSRQDAVCFALATGARRSEVFAALGGDIAADRSRVLIRGSKTDAAFATIPVPLPMRVLLQDVEPPFTAWPNARRGLARACKRAGIPTVTWNDLRRTFASLLVQAGVPPHLVAKLLRHKSTAMVDRVYGRQTAESLSDLIDKQFRREPTVFQRRQRKKRTSKRRRK